MGIRQQQFEGTGLAGPLQSPPQASEYCRGEGTRGIPQRTDCPSLALQLAQIGIGRVSKTSSFRLALLLHSALAPCRLPTCDGAGMHSSADWCLPKPEHPLQAVASPGCAGCMSANSCHVSWHTSTAVPQTLRKPGSGNSSVHMSPEAVQPYRLHLLHALAKSWGDPDMALLPWSADRSRVSLASKSSMASKEARLHAAAGSGNLEDGRRRARNRARFAAQGNC